MEMQYAKYTSLAATEVVYMQSYGFFCCFLQVCSKPTCTTSGACFFWGDLSKEHWLRHLKTLRAEKLTSTSSLGAWWPGLSTCLPITWHWCNGSQVTVQNICTIWKGERTVNVVPHNNVILIHLPPPALMHDGPASTQVPSFTCLWTLAARLVCRTASVATQSWKCDRFNHA